jgi:hypothetical protein
MGLDLNQSVQSSEPDSSELRRGLGNRDFPAEGGRVELNISNSGKDKPTPEQTFRCLPPQSRHGDEHRKFAANIPGILSKIQMWMQKMRACDQKSGLFRKRSHFAIKHSNVCVRIRMFAWKIQCLHPQFVNAAGIETSAQTFRACCQTSKHGGRRSGYAIRNADFCANIGTSRSKIRMSASAIECLRPQLTGADGI